MTWAWFFGLLAAGGQGWAAVGYRQLPAPDGEVALLPRGLGRRVYNGEVRVAF